MTKTVDVQTTTSLMCMEVTLVIGIQASSFHQETVQGWAAGANAPKTLVSQRRPAVGVTALAHAIRLKTAPIQLSSLWKAKHAEEEKTDF